jgi:hypothetical protein
MTIASALKRKLRPHYRRMARWTFDPWALILLAARRFRALPFFLRNLRTYGREDRMDNFRFSWRDAWYKSFDRYDTAASVTFHYFFQDLWAARILHQQGVRHHVDVGSRLDGFIGHVLTFSTVEYVDVRELALQIPGFLYRRGDITNLPFGDGAVPSLSSLHVLEHVGLGRYGDQVDRDGHRRAAAELTRVLAPGGTLLIGTPVGRERLCFDAHRIFDPQTVIDLFPQLQLTTFALLDDSCDRILEDASFDDARNCDYGCGLFQFRRPEPSRSDS